MNKVLIAVLHSRMAPWGEMYDTARATWDKDVVENVQTVFYTGAPATPFNNKLIGFDVQDEYKTIGHKNLLAWEWMLGFEWDIMLRVNCSTYVHKPKLFDYCQTLPKERVVRCIEAKGAAPKRWAWGGYGFIMSRDVVKAVIDNKDRWNHEHMEDVALSHLLIELGYEIDQPIPSSSIQKDCDYWTLFSTAYQSFNFNTFDEVVKSDNFIFRVKQDLKRHLDKHIMEQLHDQYSRHQA